MSWAASPSGYPPPSQRSWLERTISATGASSGAALMMRSPITVCWRMYCHSSSVSGRGACRMSSGIAILPMSCRAAARRTWTRSAAPSPISRPTRSASRATPTTWWCSSPSCSPTTPMRTRWTLSRRAGTAAALVLVQAAVGGLQRVDDVAAGVEPDQAVRAADVEAPAALGERVGCVHDRARRRAAPRARSRRTRRRPSGRRGPRRRAWRRGCARGARAARRRRGARTCRCRT